jgi:hypothetical protein
MHTKFWLKKRKGRNHFEDLGVSGRIIKIDFKGTGYGDVDCIYVVQNTDQCRALVNTVRIFGFYKRRRIFRPDGGLYVSQDRISSMKQLHCSKGAS